MSLLAIVILHLTLILPCQIVDIPTDKFEELGCGRHWEAALFCQPRGDSEIET
jgi:hypothetical protein